MAAAVTAGFMVDSTVAVGTAGFEADSLAGSMAAFTVISMAAAIITDTHGGSIRLTATATGTDPVMVTGTKPSKGIPTKLWDVADVPQFCVTWRPFSQI
jgi:hypothetical protein